MIVTIVMSQVLLCQISYFWPVAHGSTRYLSELRITNTVTLFTHLLKHSPFGLTIGDYIWWLNVMPAPHTVVQDYLLHQLQQKSTTRVWCDFLLELDITKLDYWLSYDCNKVNMLYSNMLSILSETICDKGTRYKADYFIVWFNACKISLGTKRNTPSSITTRHTMSNAELFQSDNCSRTNSYKQSIFYKLTKSWNFQKSSRNETLKSQVRVTELLRLLPMHFQAAS